jgi:hypothetical protein
MEQFLDRQALSRVVEGKINYHGDMEGRPSYVGFDPNRDRQVFDPRLMPIMDGSVAPVDTDLDREGFKLVRHPSKVTNWEDKTQLVAIYEPEIESLLRSLTDADHVLVKSTAGAYRDCSRTDTAGPVPFPHIDVNAVGVIDVLNRRFADRPKNVRRWAIYNGWRALSPTPRSEPLALLDAQSVVPSDLVTLDSGQPDFNYEAFTLRYNPNHRWTYFSQMSPEDIIVFKTWDSDPSKLSSVAHTAFTDTSFANSVPRRSYEIRAYVAWDH